MHHLANNLLFGICFGNFSVDIMEQIATTMGATHWKFNGELCQIEAVRVTTDLPSWSETDVVCNCSIGNDTACHIVAM